MRANGWRAIWLPVCVRLNTMDCSMKNFNLDGQEMCILESIERRELTQGVALGGWSALNAVDEKRAEWVPVIQNVKIGTYRVSPLALEMSAGTHYYCGGICVGRVGFGIIKFRGALEWAPYSFIYTENGLERCYYVRAKCAQCGHVSYAADASSSELYDGIASDAREAALRRVSSIPRSACPICSITDRQHIILWWSDCQLTVRGGVLTSEVRKGVRSN